MNREDIIRMAREAGMGGMLTDVVCTHAELERFAALVADKERDACAKVCEEHWEIDGTRSAKEFANAIRARGQS